jgi:hypothetical protein
VKAQIMGSKGGARGGEARRSPARAEWRKKRRRAQNGDWLTRGEKASGKTATWSSAPVLPESTGSAEISAGACREQLQVLGALTLRGHDRDA